MCSKRCTWWTKKSTSMIMWIRDQSITTSSSMLRRIVRLCRERGKLNSNSISSLMRSRQIRTLCGECGRHKIKSAGIIKETNI